MGWPAHKFALTFFAGVIVVWLAAMAFIMRQSALPPEASGTMLAVFNPGTPEDQIFGALIKAGARPIRETSFGFIWVVAGDEPGLSGRLKAQGAIGNYRDLPISPTIAGCFAYADAKVASAFQ
jgi:hypothetical protein